MNRIDQTIEQVLADNPDAVVESASLHPKEGGDLDLVIELSKTVRVQIRIPWGPLTDVEGGAGDKRGR